MSLILLSRKKLNIQYKVKMIKQIIEKNQLNDISQKHTLVEYRISKLNNYVTEIGKWKIFNTLVKLHKFMQIHNINVKKTNTTSNMTK